MCYECLFLCIIITKVFGEHNSEDNSDSHVYPYLAWSFWVGAVPDSVNRMITLLREKFQPPWTFTFLEPQNLSSVLDLSILSREYEYLSAHQQSDYIRDCLVQTYGGWWLDSSTLLLDSRVLENWVNESRQTSSDFFGFCNHQCPKKLIENGVFYAPKGSAFMTIWRREIERLHSLGADNYVYDVFRKGVTFRESLFNPYPYVRTYYSTFATMEYAIERILSRSTVFSIKTAGEYIFKLDRDCKWNRTCVHDVLQKELVNTTYPILKLHGGHRYILFGKDTQYKYKAAVEQHPLVVGTFIMIRSIRDWHIWLI